MPFKAVCIEITDKIRNILSRIAGSRTQSVREVQKLEEIFMLLTDKYADKINGTLTCYDRTELPQ